MESLLLIDVSYMCHRAYHAVGDLVFDDMATGAVFGVLRDILSLQDLFQTSRVAFAFDSRRNRRYTVMPEYKATRRKSYREATGDELVSRNGFRLQVRLLRSDYLPSAGFRNILHAVGFEADDIIASVAATTPPDQEVVIVGNDHDLWQCLRPNVWCWSPYKRQAYTEGAFRKDWGLDPRQWATVKALAGCTSDDVPGVPGVGEATAAKWLRGELGAHTKTAEKLRGAEGLLRRNMRLVQLPFPGTPTFQIVDDEVTEEKWLALTDRLGMHSLKTAVPRGVAKKSRGRKRGKDSQGFGLRSS